MNDAVCAARFLKMLQRGMLPSRRVRECAKEKDIFEVDDGYVVCFVDAC